MPYFFEDWGEGLIPPRAQPHAQPVGHTFRTARFFGKNSQKVQTLFDLCAMQVPPNVRSIWLTLWECGDEPFESKAILATGLENHPSHRSGGGVGVSLKRAGWLWRSAGEHRLKRAGECGM
ncbi:hypothetical protein [Kamptonema formosum]|uniref:hypothetical protein n=1 Tax=Kamptonema formosum TaxID=331992 RepID=UPI000349733D|nr:hypothetical protein [Oscillatoria sp. PCC 10802]